ncbi:MAG: putative transcriptional regulator [Idiomarinaceae bacterium HL-53]|nr:MAG: putative transcriptional regulator [Idiomarinaceae bacterium HL-53]CUS47849.1 Helix-turn-helix domain-containing protein [Idiomarinaceae bacterium HL-53]
MLINIQTVKQARTAKGWTQQQLADVAGLSLRTIQRVESQGQGSMETCNALCAVLEIDRDELHVENTSIDNPEKRVMIYVLIGVLGGFLSGVLVTLVLN